MRFNAKIRILRREPEIARLHEVSKGGCFKLAWDGPRQPERILHGEKCVFWPATKYCDISEIDRCREFRGLNLPRFDPAQTAARPCAIELLRCRQVAPLAGIASWQALPVRGCTVMSCSYAAGYRCNSTAIGGTSYLCQGSVGLGAHNCWLSAAACTKHIKDLAVVFEATFERCCASWEQNAVPYSVT